MFIVPCTINLHRLVQHHKHSDRIYKDLYSNNGKHHWPVLQEYFVDKNRDDSTSHQNHNLQREREKESKINKCQSVQITFTVKQENGLPHFPNELSCCFRFVTHSQEPVSKHNIHTCAQIFHNILITRYLPCSGPLMENGRHVSAVRFHPSVKSKTALEPANDGKSLRL